MASPAGDSSQPLSAGFEIAPGASGDAKSTDREVSADRWARIEAIEVEWHCKDEGGRLCGSNRAGRNIAAHQGDIDFAKLPRHRYRVQERAGKKVAAGRTSVVPNPCWPWPFKEASRPR